MLSRLFTRGCARKVQPSSLMGERDVLHWKSESYAHTGNCQDESGSGYVYSARSCWNFIAS
jgi:hypothetical protein